MNDEIPVENHKGLIHSNDIAPIPNYMENIDKIKVKGDDLTKINVNAYGVGHVLNDITGACCMNFLLYFLTKIIQISNSDAGLVVLAGQIADALATPLIGILSDRTETKFGKRTPWYIAGSFLVAISFSLIFQRCLICSEDKGTMQLMYYISLLVLYNLGWAAVQVAHMSLLPVISVNKKNKDKMVRLRTGFFFISQFFSLVISLVVFSIVGDNLKQYTYLSFICVFVGVITTIYFLIYCRETNLSKNIDSYVKEMRISLVRIKSCERVDNLMINNEEEEKKEEKVIDWRFWLSKPDFYAYMVVYMLVRLSINVTQSMIPYYLTSVLKFKSNIKGSTPVEISIVFLISMTGSVFNSLYLQENILVSKNRLVMMIWSGILIWVGCLPLIFLNRDTRWIIYIISFFMGVGFSIALSTGTSLINDVVGSKGKQGAFVYGVYSFCDKLSVGIVIYIFSIYVLEEEFILKMTTSLLPPISMFIAFLMALLVKKKKNDEPKNDSKILSNSKSFRKISTSVIDDDTFTFMSLK